jgi:penicillin-binding protein 1C
MSAAAIPPPRPARRRIASLLLAGAAGLLLIYAALWLLDRRYPLPLPDAGAGSATVVLARDGRPLRAFADADGVWRHPIGADEVAPNYLEALLHYEDRRFQRHRGVDPLALLRAAWQAVRHRRVVSGGSTLSMQVARIIDPVPRSAVGKLRQMLRAVQLEWHLDKAAILEFYLNHAPFGGTLEGVQAASFGYLGKPASQLSDAEAALLAVLPQAPSRLRPDRHPERARAGRDKVLARLQRDGVWSAQRVAAARQEGVAARHLRVPMAAPLAAERLRRANPGQQRISSTLDFDLQHATEQRVAAWIERLPPRSSAAVLIVDTASMQVRAYVGAGRFGDDARYGHLDMVPAPRSPGSTLKPFLYGLALDDGLIHSRSLLLDVPQDFDGYRPGNFDLHFRGPVDATVALQQSLNVPAVALLQALGPDRFVARMAHAGVPLRLPAAARPNLAMILGGTEARLQDLVAAFAALHRDGRAAAPRLQAEQPLAERALLSPGAAWIVREMLEGAPRPGEAGGRFDASGRSPLAFKTGTSYGFRDAWAIGAGAGATIGVWVGRPDGSPMPGHYGAVSALPLLFALADGLPREMRRSSAARPATVASGTICWPLGRRLGDTDAGHCARRLEAWLLDGSVPPTLAANVSTAPSMQSWLVERGSGRRLSDGCRDGREVELVRSVQWPPLAQPWLSAGERRAQALPPLAAGCGDPAAPRSGLQILGVIDRSVVRRVPNRPEPPTVALRALGAEAPVRWLLNGRLVGESRGEAALELRLDRPGPQQLLALDRNGRYGRVEFEVEL